MKKKNYVRLSPSRISSLTDCSWNYYCDYVLKLPNVGNDGSKRGTICHGLLEHLTRPRHKSKLKNILENDDPFADPVCARYLEIFAKKECLPIDQEVINLKRDGMESHRKMLREMIMVGLKSDFLGKEGDELIAEQVHIFEGSPPFKYKIKGIVDKTFLRRNEKGEVEEVEIADYKTSKNKFSAKKIDSNIQAYAYQFFARKLYPNVKKITFNFLFLRHPRSPWVPVYKFDEGDVEGFEAYLTYITEYLENFTEEDAKANFAKNNGGFNLCGKDGFKSYYDKATKTKIETTEPAWKCPNKDPYDYWAVVDEEGNNVRSAMTLEELNPKEGEKPMKKRYGGCPAWHGSKKKRAEFWKALT